ncbi:MAG: serine/threonine-protein kinase [Kofleriaceae bacterium]
MSATPPPRAPLPDWSEGLREGTESLTIKPDDGLGSLAMGTNEDVAGAAGFGDAEDRTKVDLHGPPAPAPAPAPRRARPSRADDDGKEHLGTTLGSYRLLSRIGKGGMGHVFLAEHVKLGRQVALKLLRQEHAKRKDAVARFFQEARTVNRARHRNIVDVTDFIELDDGTTFIIMELLTGQSLGVWARGGIAVPRALGVLAQICEGLGAAHAVGVVHRDLKPDNVIITSTPEGGDLVKLLDFGVAKLINQRDDDFAVETAAGSVVGTPAYMSPEQAGGLPIDSRSDIYSLGAIMYELFCGQTMFRGRSFGEFVRKHLTEQPLPPRLTPNGAGLDPRIEAIILRAIDKEPSRRYQTAAELRDALLQLGATTTGPQPRYAPAPGATEQLPPAAAPASTSGSSFHLTSAASAGASLARSGATHPPSTHLVRGTPWYIWFVGGALAVSLGAGGAAWYVASTGAAPDAVPAASSAPPSELVEIQLVSQPAGGAVFRKGSASELCRTPCALNLDIAELGALPIRPFVIRHDGYEDATIAVDPRSPERKFIVTLTPQPLEVAPAPAPAPSDEGHPEGATGAEDEVVLEPASAGAAAPPPRRPPRRPSRGDKDTVFELPAATTAPARPPAASLPDVPTEPPKVPPKSGKIDRSETIDPFRSQ